MVDPAARMTLVEHLDELRSRLFRCLIALVVGVIAAAILNDHIFRLLLAPLPLKFRHITTFSPAEPFMVSLKVWVYTGVILASPFITYQFWAYVGPAFETKQRRYILPVVGACSALFLGGVVFGYYIVLPKGLSWLLGLNDQFFHIQNRAQDYVSFTSTFLLAFGAVFELPVLIVLAVRLGIIDVDFLRRNRKYAIVLNAVLAAVITPSQDWFSMTAMLIPLLLFYEASIWVARLMQGRTRVRAGEDEHHDDTPEDGDDLTQATA